ncbi:hypothetical protein [Actinoplanes sp. NPDC089786]|uniref:hypothetical protein n=1 Tax=Actinoplanes sp. NPDC089786 TaxID=3155185 RepID=UPI0034309AD9
MGGRTLSAKSTCIPRKGHQGKQLDRPRRWIGHIESNREYLDSSRSGGGWRWWPLADVVNVDSKILIPDGTRESLPEDFDAVELKAVQIGVGLTAVIAFFHLTKLATRHLDDVWHAKHEPTIVIRRGRPRAEDRMWAAFRATQEARRALHDTAREWMSKRCPGFFADHQEPQPLADLLLMDQFDPTKGDRIGQGFSAALRAIGFTENVLHRTSPDLPKLLLSQADSRLCPALEGRRTWGLWGNWREISSIPTLLDGYGENAKRAIAYWADSRIRHFLVTLSVSDFLSVTEGEYAEMRDRAKVRHGAFRLKQLNYLRRKFLTISLDLTTVASDVDQFWKRTWRDQEEAEFTLDYAPWIVENDEREGRARFTPVSVNDELRERQESWFKRLLIADRDYRDILSTVASLGASADAVKVSRIALWAAVASLAVASVTLLVTEAKKETFLHLIVSWLSSISA